MIDLDAWINATALKCATAGFYEMFPAGPQFDPPVLWHYTNAEALSNILATKTMYASHYEYLNDPSECKMFVNIAHEIAAERLKNLPKIKDDQKLKTKEEYLTALWKIIASLDAFFPAIKVCVACFSESGDLLSQWRSYADNCKGYALGISTESIAKHSITSKFSFKLIRVLYKPESQKIFVSKIMNCLVDGGAQALATCHEDQEGEVLDSWVSLLKRVSAEFSPAIKHPAYIDEREWRLVSFGRQFDPKTKNAQTPKESRQENKIKVRISQGNFIQYMTINFLNVDKKHPFRKITIGPINQPDNEIAAIKLMLQNLKMEKEISISNSKIPVRVSV